MARHWRERQTYPAPGTDGSPVELKARYENFIGGEWVAPINGEYSENLTPATGEPFTRGAALDAGGHRARARRRARREGRVGRDVDDRARRRC